MYEVNVSCGEVTSLYVCVCAYTGKESILVIVLQIYVIIKASVVTRFAICWQFDVVCWNWSLSALPLGV